eukprot:1140438-Pelagomonas_calceolata.AAC.2
MEARGISRAKLVLFEHFVRLRKNERKEKKNYVGRQNFPYINLGKGDTLTLKSRESPPPQNFRTKELVGGWRVTGSTWIQNLALFFADIFEAHSMIGLGKDNQGRIAP